MTTSTDISRTTHLLELTKQGDDAFNDRDFVAMDAIHHPDMIAHLTGSAQPTYGLSDHSAMVEPLFRVFPDIHVDNDPYPVQFGSGDWVSVSTRVRGTFSGEMILPDGTVIAPTGKTFDVDFAKIIRFEGDLLIEEFVFWDSALQARQIGLA